MQRRTINLFQYKKKKRPKKPKQSKKHHSFKEPFITTEEQHVLTKIILNVMMDF